MDAKTSKILNSLFWALLAVLLLWLSFRGVDWPEFLRVLVASRWGYVLLAMAAGVLSFLLRSFRWRLLMLPVDPGIKRIDCYDGFAIGRICDFAVPHVSNLVRCGYVLTPRMTYDKALGTVVLERVWDIVMLALITLLLLFFWGERFGAFFMDKMLRPAASRLAVNPWLMALALLGAVLLVCLCIYAVRRSRFRGRVAKFFRGIVHGFSSFMEMKGKGMFLLLTALLWFSYFLMSWFIIKALPMDFGFTAVDALFIMLVGALAGIVPVPGGFGAFHYIVALALQTLYAIPFDTGLIFATLSHESQAVVLIVCGLLAYVHQAYKRNRRKS